jgi:hypothetical protein
MEGPAFMPIELGAHLWALMGGVVVQDDMDQLAGGHHGLDRAQEADEFLMAVAACSARRRCHRAR